MSSTAARAVADHRSSILVRNRFPPRASARVEPDERRLDSHLTQSHEDLVHVHPTSTDRRWPRFGAHPTSTISTARSLCRGLDDKGGKGYARVARAITPGTKHVMSGVKKQTLPE